MICTEYEDESESDYFECKCSSCLNGYSNDGRNCTECNRRIDSRCKTFDDDFCSCSVCHGRYYIEHGICKKCEEKYLSNCREHDKNKCECIECEQGLTPNNEGICMSCSEDGVEGCKVCSHEYGCECSECSAGFKSDGGKFCVATQDFLTCCYLITQKGTFFEKKEFKTKACYCSNCGVKLMLHFLQI